MTTARDALAALRMALDSGRYPPGARLPAERDLSITLGVGRGTLRKALTALAREGRIRRRVGEGTFVTDGGQDEGGGLPLNAPPTPADVMEVRQLVEPGIAAAAALRARGPEIATLRRLADPAEGGDWRAWETRDTAFHAAVAAATRNPLLTGLLETLRRMRAQEEWGRLRRQTLTPARQRLFARQHHGVVDAIERRDAAGAAEAMRRHLASVNDALSGSAAPGDAETGAGGTADARMEV